MTVKDTDVTIGIDCTDYQATIVGWDTNLSEKRFCPLLKIITFRES